MGLKTQAGELQDSCLDKLRNGEPFFVIRGQDKVGPETVRQWARMARAEGANPRKVNEALELADRMEAWQRHNAVKVPD